MPDYYEYDYPNLNAAHRYRSSERGSYVYPGRGPKRFRYKDGSERMSDGVRPTEYYTGSASSSGSTTENNKVSHLTDDGLSVHKVTTGGRTSIEDGNVIWVYNSHVGVTPYKKFVLKHAITSKFEDVGNRLLDKVDNQTFDLGAIIAESGETSKYILSRGLQIAKFATSLVSGNIPGALRAVGLSPNKVRQRVRKARREGLGMHAASSLSAAWLEYNFAIRPLVGDISTAAALYQDPTTVLNKLNLTVTASSRVSDKREYKNIVHGGDKIRYYAMANRRMSVTYSIVDAEQVANKALGLNAPLASAWELVPFSWVIDYVVNIGDYLRLQNATDGLAFSHGYVSTKFEQTVNYNFSRTTNRTIGLKRYNNRFRTRLRGNVACYERSPIYSFPSPSIVIDPAVSLRQTSYLAALSTQLVQSYLTNRK